MLFLNGYKDEERFTFVDVFGRDKFFFKDSKTRIMGWETSVSTFLTTKDNALIVKFKKTLLKYTKGFKDSPFECDLLEPLRSFRRKNYYSDEMKRKRFIEYALKKYKESKTGSFEPQIADVTKVIALRNNKYTGDEYLDDEYVIIKKAYDKENGTVCFWFPVDIDTVIVNRVNDEKSWSTYSTCFLVDFQINVIMCELGSDKNLYSFGLTEVENKEGTMCKNYKLFSIEGGLKELPVKEWMSNVRILTSPIFLQDYIILEDNKCITYDGYVLHKKTLHYRNVSLINRIIADLLDYNPEPQKYDLNLKLTNNNDIEQVTLKLIENVIVPYVLVSGFLKKKSIEQFYCLASIYKKSGLKEEDFQVVYKNLRELNKHPIYGGDIENVCSKKILKTIANIQGEIPKQDFDSLLKDEIALKKEVAKHQGLTVIERFMSDEELSDICWDDDNKEKFWKDIPLHSLVYIRTSSISCFLAYENTDEGIEVDFV